MERLMLLSLICLASLGALAAANSGTNLDEINASMQRVETFSASFEQIKNFKILSSPLKLTGRIYIRRSPFKLGWHVDTPVVCLTVMDGDRLTQWEEGGKAVTEINMGDNPVLKTVADAYRGILTGNFSFFETNCRLSFDRSGRRLTAVAGKDSDMGRFISMIEFCFSENMDFLEKININEVNGGTTEIFFSKVLINQPLPSEAWRIRK